MSRVANRSIVLSSKANPFRHGHKPFVGASLTPDLFRVPGISLIERMDQLQEMLWTIMNQRLDNLLLANNVIVKFRSDVEDPDAYPFEPGARWPVESMDQVEAVFPEAAATVNLSLPTEQSLKGDLQNTTVGMPFLAGSEQGSVDQKTATGVSIVTSLAQRVLGLRKQHFTWAFKELGQQWVALDQQFIREERLIEIVGEGGDRGYITVSPEEIQGRFDFTVEMAQESLMRQERRAESQALLQIAAQVAPLFAAVGQPLNPRAFMEKVLDDYEIPDKDRYFSSQPQALPQGQPGQAPSPEANGGPGGVTSPLAYGPSSPSSQVSNSPEVFLQRALASQGGAANT